MRAVYIYVAFGPTNPLYMVSKHRGIICFSDPTEKSLCSKGTNTDMGTTVERM